MHKRNREKKDQRDGRPNQCIFSQLTFFQMNATCRCTPECCTHICMCGSLSPLDCTEMGEFKRIWPLLWRDHQRKEKWLRLNGLPLGHYNRSYYTSISQLKCKTSCTCIQIAFCYGKQQTNSCIAHFYSQIVDRIIRGWWSCFASSRANASQHNAPLVKWKCMRIAHKFEILFVPLNRAHERFDAWNDKLFLSCCETNNWQPFFFCTPCARTHGNSACECVHMQCDIYA